MNRRTANDQPRVADGGEQYHSVAAGVSPAVEGGVSPPGIPVKVCQWSWCSHLHAWIAPILLTAWVILGCGISLAAVPVFRALPSGTKRPPVKPTVRVDLLEMEMRVEGAPAWVQPGMFRVAGVVQSVGGEGVLLYSAGAVSWMQVDAEANGNLTTTLVPGAKMNPAGGLLFLAGVQAKVGELITCETLRAGFHTVQVGGKAMRVIRFRKVRGSESR
jgi:hypothetical protein